MQIAQKAILTKIENFVPSEQKAQQLKDETEKKETPNETTVPIDDLNQQEELLKLYKTSNLDSIQVEEFEKDIDTNFHIDLIYGLSSCRCQNYKLPQMDWVGVKLKAGKIVPALATTTACIAALQTIELVKVVKRCKLETIKNAFLNLAIPLLQLTEPGPPPKFNIRKDLQVTIWDRWDIKIKLTDGVQKVFQLLQEQYNLIPVDAFYKSKVIFMKALSLGDNQNQTYKQPLINHFGENTINDYVDLTITFTDNENGEILKNTPKVRVYFEQI